MKKTKTNSASAALTIGQFARKNRVSQPAVSKAIKAGRLPLTANGKLGPEAQAAWDQSRQTRGLHSGKLIEIAELKRRRELVRLKREELELLEKQERMTDAGVVDAELASRFLEFRDSVRRLPALLAPRIAGLTETAIRTLLARELDTALTELSKLRVSKLKKSMKARRKHA